jgi:hypothetical protein
VGLPSALQTHPQDVATLVHQPSWWATWDVVRKWFEEKTEYFALPDLDEVADPDTMPRAARIVQGGGDTRKRKLSDPCRDGYACC